ncbi:MAG TPA: hypothetical protein VJZ00_15660 [Thermoanaerobaculia bacterium]|nr:hypothetical protein [Thermoanaerobaculia bacterium]
MDEQPQEPVSTRPEDQPGYGVDRTQIRALLELTPAERLDLFVASARNLAEFIAKTRFV